MNDFIEHTDNGDRYKEPRRHEVSEVIKIRLYCEHEGCNKYIIGKGDIKLPRDLVRLILRLKPTGNFRYFPVDYLIFNSNDYIFVEQKTNSAKISEKQLKVSNIIQDAGYKVAELHVSVSLGSKAEVECRELHVVEG